MRVVRELLEAAIRASALTSLAESLGGEVVNVSADVVAGGLVKVFERLRRGLLHDTA
jgi:hypothetical protein